MTPATVEKSQTTVVGTVTPGTAGDTLTLTETAGSGTLSLGAVQADGTQQVIYQAPFSISGSTQDTVGYTITESDGETATANATVLLDGGPSITPVTPTAVTEGQTTEIGTVTPGLTGDTLTLNQTGGSGTVALQTVDGVEEVIYTAPSSIPTNDTDAVSYTITDQHNDASSNGNATVQLQPSPSTTPPTDTDTIPLPTDTGGTGPSDTTVTPPSTPPSLSQVADTIAVDLTNIGTDAINFIQNVSAQTSAALTNAIQTIERTVGSIGSELGSLLSTAVHDVTGGATGRDLFDFGAIVAGATLSAAGVPIAGVPIAIFGISDLLNHHVTIPNLEHALGLGG